MKRIPNWVTTKIGRQLLVGQKHSPTVLFGAGVVGVITTTVLACRATLKLEEVLEETKANLETSRTLSHKDYSEKDRQKDTAYIYIRGVVAVTKLYGPALIVGALSVASLAGSHNILTKRNAALTAAYAALDKGFAEYRRRVVSEFGEEKDRELRHGVAVYDGKNDNTGKTDKSIMRAGPAGASIYARFFDEYSRSWSPTPEYNLLFLKCQQNYANDLLHSRGHVFLNEIYDMLGIERSKAGAVVGWVISTEYDNYIDLGLFDGDNPRARDFVNGREGSILLDFNVDGVIYDKI